MEEFIVNHWLKQIYGQDIPPFEVNDETITVLKRLFDQFKSSESGLSIILDQMKGTESELEADTSRLKLILTSLNFTLDTLPVHLNDLLTSFSELAVSLKSGTTDLSSMFMLLSNHTICIKDSNLDSFLPIERINESICDKTSEICNEISNLKIKTKIVRECVEDGKESMIKKQSDVIFLQKKRKEYVDSRKQNEMLLKESEFHEKISHQNTTILRREVEKLEAYLSELRIRKHYYKTLPLNLTLAKVRLEETKLELKKLNQEILEKLNLNTQ